MARDAVKELIAEWLDEPEGYAIRRERLLDDIANGNDIVPWLEAAAAVAIEGVLGTGEPKAL